MMEKMIIRRYVPADLVYSIEWMPGQSLSLFSCLFVLFF